MTYIEVGTLIISLVGAAAWIPQLIKFFQRPKLTIIPAESCEIGFTELGPVLNLQIIITADRESVLIDSFELSVSHETGDSYLFSWHEIEEIKGHLVNNRTQKSSLLVDQSQAIAIKVLATDFKSLYLRNRLREHTKEMKIHMSNFNRESNRLKDKNQFNPDEFNNSKVIKDISSFMQSQMIWKKGEYKIEFYIHNRSNAKISMPVVKFKLTDEDIPLLQKNCNNIPVLLNNICFHVASKHNEIYNLEWYWLNKDLSLD